MPLPSEAYSDLETIVGSENISSDPAILDSYCCHATFFGAPSQSVFKNIWWKRAEAIVLPANTEQVQQIVNVCNYYGLKFKAHSTGQAPMAFCQAEMGITIDLRRMNRILEINEEHMYCLVEPYVVQGELFFETIRHGLVPHMIDAGSSISPLASVTSVGGSGDSAISRGYNERNALAVEWILPNGTLIRLGTPETPNAGWFTGDGPGPSLLGLMRGGLGQLGGRGIFTKVAIKLYPWHGPKEIERGGIPPWYEIKEFPWSEIILMNWDDYKNEAKGLYQIGEAEIFDSLGRYLNPTLIESVVAEDKNDWIAIRKSKLYEKLFYKGGWCGHIVAKGQAHFEYCKKAIERIMAMTKGRIWKVEEVPIPEGVKSPKRFSWKLKQALLNLLLFKNLTLKACVMSMGGTVGSLPMQQYTSIDKQLEDMVKVAIPVRKKYQDLGQVLDDGPDGCWATIDEGGHMMQHINFTRMEIMDPKASGFGIGIEGLAKSLKFGFPIVVSMPHLDKINVTSKYHSKFMKKLDPNKTTDAFDLNYLARVFGDYDDDEEEEFYGEK